MNHYVLTFLLIFFVPHLASGQQVDERVLKKQTLKKVRKNIEINKKKGYIPTNLAITGRGRFSVRMVKLGDRTPWEIEFELTDEQFETRFAQNRQKQLRLVTHEEYESKKEHLHACLWHFDESIVPLTEKELRDEANRPEAQPLGTIWKPDALIPYSGMGGPYAAFEARVVEYMRANQIPAISVAFAIKGRPAYKGSFGYADLDRLKKVTPDSAFRTVWVSRLITAIATLQLVERGKLKLDQPVYPLLAIEPWQPATVDSRVNQITIKHLLQMTAGYDHKLSINPLYQAKTVMEKMKTDSLTEDQVVAFMMSQPLTHDPGTKRVLSDYGFFLLGRAIEKVSGKSYEEYVRENVAERIGLKSLMLSQIDSDRQPKHSVMHYSRNGAFSKKLHGKEKGQWALPREGGGRHYGLTGSSGGWLAAPMDLLALGGDLQATKSKLLSADAKGIMAAMPDYQLEGAIHAKPKMWSGMGLTVRKAAKGLDFWMESRGGGSTNSLVCFSNGTMRCVMMNCAETVSGVSTIESFQPIAIDGLKVAKQVNGR